MITTALKNYLKDYLNIQKNCDGKCDGDNSDECEKCLIISTHTYLYGELKKKLALSQEVDSKNNDINSFLTGSYRRHTIIRPPKDVDGFVTLNADDYKDYTATEIIELIYSELLEIYAYFDPQPEIIIQSHSVCVKFSDTFGADVIPAFPEGDLYKIPELDGSDDGIWLVSNPNNHVEYVSRVNQENSNLVIPIVKLLKSWKRDKFDGLDIDMKSFHLEMLAVKIFDENNITSYSEGLITFFSKASDYLAAPIEDPALVDTDTESDLNDLLDDQSKEKLIDLIKEELVFAENAANLDENGENVDALNELKKIFTSSDFEKSCNETIGKDIAAKLAEGQLLSRSKDSGKYSFESTDEGRTVPRAKSWQKN